MLHRMWATPRARFFLASAVGGALALVVFAYFLLEGRADLFAPEFLADFYDVQARALMHGHWDVGSKALAFERFTVDGKYYTYFGPWPSLLRMPVLAVTHDLDGELSRVSMLIAYVVALMAVARMSWQARTFVRGDSMPAPLALVGAGGFVLLVGCGSTLLFLGGRSWVYHEAVLWGVAWAFTAYACIVAYLVEPSRKHIILAGLTSTLAFLSRATIGAGPVMVLGIIVAARVSLWARDAWRRHSDGAESAPSAWWLRWLGFGSPAANRSILPVVAATTIPIALYAYVNFSKFGTLLGLPLEKQDIIVASPTAKAAFDANNGSITGLVYSPTNLLQYFRPDAIGFDRLFPWVTFSKPPRVFGGAVFIDIDFSASITATSTLLVLLAIVGIVAIIRAPRRREGASSAAVLRVPVAVAVIPGLVTVSIAYLQQRYQADFLPALVIAGAAGLWWLPSLLGGRARALRVAVLTLVVVLGAWSCWAMGSLTYLHQRAYGPLVPEASTARLVDVQLAVYDAISGGAPSHVEHVPSLPLPPPGERQSLLVIGDCDGLSYSVGRAWIPVEETPATGLFDLRVTFDDLPAGTREPLLSSSDSRGSGVVWAEHLREGRVRFEYEWNGTPERAPSVTQAIRVAPGEVVRIGIRLDPSIGYFDVRHDGRYLGLDYTLVANSPAAIGSQDVSDAGARTFAGTIDSLPIATPICDRLARLERG
ncbi:MAG: hypothetical protein MUP97_18510 [Acidimicrobiia bacterium]|nr:hypothetical protein [Acidimicrobiia bacterium]